MTETLQHLLNWVGAHPGGAQLLLLAFCFVDSLFLVGAVVPVVPVLFAYGALIALGTLELWPTVLIAAAGALAGDLLSFRFGLAFGPRLFELPALKKYPEALNNGRRFFERHGGKSVLLARFLGPVRAVTPAIAGAAGMKPWLFLVVDTGSAVIWALAYILPGVVFGASIGLAAQVAGRLAVLMLGLVAVIWLAVVLTLAAGRALQRHAEQLVGGMLDWSRRHRRLGVFGAVLADRDQPETPALAAVAGLLLTLGVTVLLLIWGASGEREPPGADLAVFQWLQSVHEPTVTLLAVYCSLLGEWPVYIPYASMALIMLLWHRQKRAAAHWLAALLFGGAITLGLGLVSGISNPLEYRGFIGHARFPHDLVMSVVIYGFTPVLLGAARSYYALTVVALVSLLLSRLYLGTLWLSVELVAVICGLLWVAALGLGYHRHLRGENPALRQLAPALALLAAAALWHWHSEADARVQVHSPVANSVQLDGAAWWKGGWENLPGRRQDMAGRDKQYLNLQWAGALEAIDSALRAQGWEPPQEMSIANTLRWLAPGTPIGELALLPRYHGGRHQALTLRRGIDDSHQHLLRLWPTDYRLDDATPLWIGTLVVQETRPVARLFRYPINSDVFTPALDSLNLPLAGFESQRVQRSRTSYTTLLLKPARSE